MMALLLAGADPAGSDAGLAWTQHAVGLFAFASGIALWLAGRSYLRVTFALAGGGIGALSGFEVLHALGTTLNPLIGAGGGFVLGSLLGLVAFRFVVALSLGGVGALAAGLVTLGAFNAGLIRTEVQLSSAADADGVVAARREAGDDRRVRSLTDEAMRTLAPLAFSEDSAARGEAFVGPILSGAAVDLAGHAAERARLFFAALGDQVAPIWNGLPSGRRMTLSGAGLVGLIIGLLVGFLLPSRGAAVATSFIGPAIWLPTGLFLLSALDVPVERWAPARPLVWMGVWLALASVGLLVQWTRRSPRADKA